MIVPLSAAASQASSAASAESVLAGANGRSASSTATGSRDSVGKDDFLKLLVTQLKNQDPTNPMQPHEFAAQLAQFTSVEQLTQVNAGIAALSAQNQLSTLMSETSFSASLVGKTIVAQGDQVEIPKTGQGAIRIDVGLGGGAGTLTLKDANGRSVATVPLGNLSAGPQTVALPADLPPGKYTYAVDVKGANDAKVAVRTFVTGTVDGVHFSNGTITLRVGSMEIGLDSLSEIGKP